MSGGPQRGSADTTISASGSGAVAVHVNHGSITTSQTYVFAMMPEQVDGADGRLLEIVELLGRCLVRLGTADQPAGAGFFVAPGLVVTCGRLVPVAAGDGRVAVRHGETTHAADVLHVDADVAVLRLVDPPDGHPCARLDARMPQWGSELVVWGYPDPGRLPRTTQSGFALHDRFLGLPGFDATAGATGGPVLSVVSGRVCGVMTTGGLALPVRGLRHIDAGVYRDLRRGHDRFHRADRRWSARADGPAPAAPHDITPDQQTRLYALLAALPPADDHVERYLRVFPLATERDPVQLDYADTADDLRALAPTRGELPHVVAYAADLVSDLAPSPVAAQLRDWVFGAAGRFDLDHVAAERLAGAAETGAAGDEQSGPYQAVRRFRESAAPDAYRLAALLSAAPLIGPVIDAVRSALLPQTGRAEITEILTSDLVTPDRHGTRHDFADGVRDVLLGTLTAHETAAVLDTVTAYIGDALTRADPAEDVPPAHLAGLFAGVRAQAIHRAAGTSGPDDVAGAFGQVCPVCRATLGAPLGTGRTGRLPAVPSFQLEVGPADDTVLSWRLTAHGVDRLPPVISDRPRFDAGEVEHVYLLCGNGHIFAKDLLVDEWKTVAVVGSPASGKTYLTIRMLHQNLTNPHRWALDDADALRVRRHRTSPLERLPLDRYRETYARMLRDGRALSPTQAERAHPADLLQQALPDAVEALHDLVERTVLDGERRARQWGLRFHQPLALHTSAGGRHAWTGFTDAPGEAFSGATTDAAHLLTHDAVLWVLDPAAASVDTADLPAETIEGSLRPGTTTFEGTATVRRSRGRIQAEIGEHLATLDGSGSPSELYVTVSKCDLIHALLLRNHRLAGMGVAGAVFRGTAGYLSHAARRWGRHLPGADPMTAAVIDHLARTGDHPRFADALLDHYSDPDAFLGLVHHGAADRITVPGSTLTIDVPGIGEHLDRCRPAGSGRHLLTRDLVMSAVACGVAAGLGLADTVHQLLRQPWRRLQFFLCTPLAVLPAAAAEDRIVPAAADQTFPEIGERSAGLTQLLLLARSGRQGVSG